MRTDEHSARDRRAARAAIALAASRGRHLAWIVFLAIAILSMLGAR